jgi:adenosylhomocysteine nucleosidase
VNTGSAGGLRADLTFGDVVISDGLLHHDADVTAFGYAPARSPGFPRCSPRSPPWWNGRSGPSTP